MPVTLGLSNDPYPAADLTADVFVAAIESAGSYRRSRGEPVAWLFGIARNVVADERRRNAKELRTAARVRGRELVDEHDLAALHERIDRESAARALYQELGRLPAGERAVLELVALDGLSVTEVGHAPGLQAALEAAGVNAVVEYLPEGKMCQQPWFAPAGHTPGTTQTGGVERESDGSTRFTISGDEPAGATLVITTQTGPGGEQALGIGWAKGDVPPCQVVDAPAGSGPLGGPPDQSNSSP